MSSWIKGKDQAVKTDEFELHDVIATAYHLDFKCNKNKESVNEVVLVPKGFNYRKTHYYRKHPKGTHYIKCKMPKPRTIFICIGPRDALRLQKKVNDMIKHMHEVDVFLHEVAEYTC